jgi:hypothetical protein
MPKTHSWLAEIGPMLYDKTIRRFTNNKLSYEFAYMIESLLSFIDGDVIDEYDDIMDFFMEHGSTFAVDMERHIDPLKMGFKYNTICKNNPPIPEIYIPSYASSYMKLLTLHENNWDAWLAAKPFKLWTHTSDELQLDLSTGYLKYKEDPPEFIFSMIDCRLLVLMFFSYVKTVGKYSPDLKNTFFVSSILPHVIFDLCDVWLIRQVQIINNMEDKSELKNVFKSFTIYDDKTTFVGEGYQQAAEEIFDLARMVGSINITPMGFIESIPLTRGETIGSRMRSTIEERDLPHLAQYRPYRFLRDMDVLNTLLPLYEYTCGKNSRHAELTNRLDITLTNKYINPKVWEALPDAMARSFIENGILDFHTRIDYRNRS